MLELTGGYAEDLKIPATSTNLAGLAERSLVFEAVGFWCMTQ